MCEIVAQRDDAGVWTQTLSGADANAIMEVREQNTLNGSVRIFVVNVDDTGAGTFGTPHPGVHLYYDLRNLADAASVPLRLVVGEPEAPPPPDGEGGARGRGGRDARGAETQAGAVVETITWIEVPEEPPLARGDKAPDAVKSSPMEQKAQAQPPPGETLADKGA